MSQIPTRGGRPNTSFLSTLDPTILTSTGLLKVNSGLQVPLASGKRNVYGVGDILDLPEQKQIAKGDGHIAIVSANILSALNGKKGTAQYKKPAEVILVTNGMACHLPGFIARA